MNTGDFFAVVVNGRGGGGEWGQEDHRFFGMFRVIDSCLHLCLVD